MGVSMMTEKEGKNPATPVKASLGAGGRTGRGIAAWAAQAGLAAMILVPPAHAQTCAEPKAADFKVNTLVETGLKNPVHLAVAPDGRVFIADMNTGEIRLYKPGTA